MSKAKEQKSEDKPSRVRVGNLPDRERELTKREAENIKGGGGLSGGVVADRSQVKHIGEEIPQ